MEKVQSPPKEGVKLVNTAGDATLNHTKYLKRKAKLQEMISNNFNFIVDKDFNVMDMRHSVSSRPTNEYVLVTAIGTTDPCKKRKKLMEEFLRTYKLEMQAFKKPRYAESSFYVQITTLCNEDVDASYVPAAKPAVVEKSAHVKNYDILCMAHMRLPLYGASLGEQPDIEDGFAYFKYFDEACMKKASSFFSSCGIESGTTVPITPSNRNTLMFMLNFEEDAANNLSGKKEQFDLTYDEKIVLDHVYWILNSYLKIPGHVIDKGIHREEGVSSLYKVKCGSLETMTSVSDAFALYSIPYIPHGDNGHRYNLNFFIPMSVNALEIYHTNVNIKMKEFTALLKERNNSVASNSNASNTPPPAPVPQVVKLVAYEEMLPQLREFMREKCKLKMPLDYCGSFHRKGETNMVTFYPKEGHRAHIIGLFKKHKLGECFVDITNGKKGLTVDLVKFLNPNAESVIETVTPESPASSVKQHPTKLKKGNKKGLIDLKAKVYELLGKNGFKWENDYYIVRITAKKICSLGCRSLESVEKIFEMLVKEGICVIRSTKNSTQTLYMSTGYLHKDTSTHVVEKTEPVVVAKAEPVVSPKSEVNEAVEKILHEAKEELLLVMQQSKPETKTVEVPRDLTNDELADLFISKFPDISRLSFVTNEGAKMSMEPITKALLVKLFFAK